MKKTIFIVLTLIMITYIVGCQNTFDNAADNLLDDKQSSMEDTSNLMEAGTMTEVDETKKLDSVIELEGDSWCITRGTTGEQIELSDQVKCDELKKRLGNIVLNEQEDDIWYGYDYAIKIMDVDGQEKEQFCITSDLIQISGKSRYRIEGTEALLEYLNEIFSND